MRAIWGEDFLRPPRLRPRLSDALTRLSTSSDRRSRSSARRSPRPRSAGPGGDGPVRRLARKRAHRPQRVRGGGEAPRTHRGARAARERSDLPGPALLVAITALLGPGGLTSGRTLCAEGTRPARADGAHVLRCAGAPTPRAHRARSEPARGGPRPLGAGGAGSSATAATSSTAPCSCSRRPVR